MHTHACTLVDTSRPNTGTCLHSSRQHPRGPSLLSLGRGSPNCPPRTPVDPLLSARCENNVPGPRHAAPETTRLVSDFMENVSQSCPRPSPLPPGAPPAPTAPLAPTPPAPVFCAAPHSSPDTSSSHILRAQLSCSFTSQPPRGLTPLPWVLSQDRKTAILRHRVGAERQLDPGLRQDGCPSWTPGVEDEVPRPPQPHPRWAQGARLQNRRTGDRGLTRPKNRARLCPAGPTRPRSTGWFPRCL